MLRAARELLAVRSPLDAELMVSELLGTWWGQRAPRGGRRGHADVEELVGEGLVGYAGLGGVGRRGRRSRVLRELRRLRRP
jgi:hypothetical protein